MPIKSRIRTHSMYLVSGSFAALTMGNPTLVAAMVQDEAAVEQGEVVTDTAPAMTDEQQMIFDGWPADQQSAFMGWPDETKAYYWSLPAERQELFWRLTDDNKVSLAVMGEEDQSNAWQMIEARAAAVESDAAAPPPPAGPPEPEAQAMPQPEAQPQPEPQPER